MKAYFNGSWIENKIILPLNDRALQFGDGAFETMIYQHGKINYLNAHLQRLNEALLALNMDPAHFTEMKIHDIVVELLNKNSITETARIKLLVWRKNQKQRAYGSAEKQFNYLIQTFRSDPIDLNILTMVEYSDSTRNFESVISPFKTLSSLSYVLAAQERDYKNLEELILLDIKGNLSECIASNLFWIKDDQIFTPTLSTGCINGIMRRQLIKWSNTWGSVLQEVKEKPKALKNASHVFSIKVAGINIFNSVGSNTYETKGELLNLIIEKVLDPN